MPFRQVPDVALGLHTATVRHRPAAHSISFLQQRPASAGPPGVKHTSADDTADRYELPPDELADDAPDMPDEKLEVVDDAADTREDDWVDANTLEVDGEEEVPHAPIAGSAPARQASRQKGPWLSAHCSVQVAMPGSRLKKNTPLQFREVAGWHTGVWPHKESTHMNWEVQHRPESAPVPGAMHACEDTDLRDDELRAELEGELRFEPVELRAELLSELRFELFELRVEAWDESAERELDPCDPPGELGALVVELLPEAAMADPAEDRSDDAPEARLATPTEDEEPALNRGPMLDRPRLDVPPRPPDETLPPLRPDEETVRLAADPPELRADADDPTELRLLP